MSAALSAPPSVATQPRFRLLLGNQPIYGTYSVEVNETNYNTASKFIAEVVLGLDPTYTMAWWANQQSVQVEVQMGDLPPGSPEGSGVSWQSMIIGNTDSIEIDPIQNSVKLSGRDFSSLMIDTKTQNAYPNQTASQVAAAIAAAHGLQASITPTTTPVGMYYEIDHTKIVMNNLQRETTEWDLLTTLADLEGYGVWVQGTTLYFQPPPTPQTVTPYPIYFNPGPPIVSNALTLTMERDLTIAQDIQVTVKTWNSRNQSAYTRVVKGVAGTSPKGSKPVNYVFVKPGLTPDQALKFAQQQLSILSLHERKVHVTMPGEYTITPHGMAQLYGTQTAFDLTYYVAEVERKMSFTDGFTQNLLLKNTSPRSQETVL